MLYRLGKVYELGLGPAAKDAARAQEWLRAAAEMGHPAAQADLGALLLLAPGGGEPPADAREAELWLQRAAAQGSGAARLRLARRYLARRDARRLGGLARGWLRSARLLSSKTTASGVMQLGAALGAVPAAIMVVFALPFPAG